MLIIGSHKATVWMSISSEQPGKGNFWTRDWRTARAPSAVPAPLHIEKAVLHAYSQESFTGEVGPVDMTCLTTEYGLRKTNKFVEDWEPLELGTTWIELPCLDSWHILLH